MHRSICFIFAVIWGAGLNAAAPAQQVTFGPLQTVAGNPSIGGGDVGFYCQLRHDGFGGQHVVYFDRTFRDLRYARRGSTADPWVIRVLASEGEVGRHGSLAVTHPQQLSGQAVISPGQDEVGLPPAFTANEQMIGGRLSLNGGAAIEVVGVRPETNALVLASTWTGPNQTPNVFSLEYYHPFITYQRTIDGERRLEVARPGSDGDFVFETIDSTNQDADSTQTGYYTSAQMETPLVFNVAYQDQSTTPSGSGRLRYARYLGNEWVVETVDGGPDVGTLASLVLDDSGIPFIFYKDEATNQLLLRRKINTLWKTEFIDTTGRLGNDFEAFFLRGQAKVIMAYQRANATAGNLREIVLMRGGYIGPTLTFEFSTEVIELGSGPGEFISLTSPPATRGEHVVYYDSVAERLMMTRYDNTNSTFTTPITLDAGPNVGLFPSASLHPGTGDLYTAYYDENAGAVKLSHFDGATTSTSVIDGESVGTFSDIGITSSEVVVAYHDDVEGSLRVTRWPIGGDPGVGTDVLVDGGSADVGEFVSMAVDSLDRIWLAYYDRANADLKVALYNDAGVWSNRVVLPETSPNQFNIGEFTDLALNWDESEIAAVFRNADSSRANLATATIYTSPGLVVQQLVFQVDGVGSFGETGRFASATYDPVGRVHASYLNESGVGWRPEYNLRAASNVAIEDIEPEDVFLQGGLYTSIAIDTNNNYTVVAYHDITNAALKVARRTAPNTWDIQTLDTDGVTGLYNDLLIDRNSGLEYLVYYNESAGECRLLARQPGDVPWVGPFVVAEGVQGIRPRLAFDPATNFLYVVLHDLVSGDLKTVKTTQLPTLNLARPIWLRQE